MREANAVIVGDVVIGRGSRIASGAFVTESVPPYILVRGNPAEVAKCGCTLNAMDSAPV
jgi:serine O-acetyltransferase